MSIGHVLKDLSANDRRELDERLRERRETYEELATWLRSRGYPGIGYKNIRNYAVAEKLRPSRRAPLLKIDRLLSPEHRAGYEQFIADPRVTNRDAMRWLSKHGYDVRLSAVRIHRQRFVDALANIRDSARVATEVVTITRTAGAAKLSEGVVAKLEQVIFEQLFKLKERKKKIAPRDLSELAKCIAQTVNTRDAIESIRAKFEEEKRKASKAAEDAAKGGATGKDVVVRMREILGV
jgi:hypothetical protein